MIDTCDAIDAYDVIDTCDAIDAYDVIDTCDAIDACMYAMRSMHEIHVMRSMHTM